MLGVSDTFRMWSSLRDSAFSQFTLSVAKGLCVIFLCLDVTLPRYLGIVKLLPSCYSSNSFGWLGPATAAAFCGARRATPTTPRTVISASAERGM